MLVMQYWISIRLIDDELQAFMQHYCLVRLELWYL